jgi:succinylglutamate desuccinylase
MHANFIVICSHSQGKEFAKWFSQCVSKDMASALECAVIVTGHYGIHEALRTIHSNLYTHYELHEALRAIHSNLYTHELHEALRAIHSNLYTHYELHEALRAIHSNLYTHYELHEELRAIHNNLHTFLRTHACYVLAVVIYYCGFKLGTVIYIHMVSKTV